MEFRADDRVRKSANLHIQMCTEMNDVAQEVLGLCSKDLVSSEAKYHATCYKNFVRVIYQSKELKSSGVENDDNEPDDIYDTVFEFCSDLIKSPRVVEFKMIRKIMPDEAQKMGIEIPQSDYKNLTRKISNRFEELQFVQKSPDSVLVYPSTIKTEDLVSENYDLQSELNTFNNLKSDNESVVINAAKMLHNEIKTHPPAMSWTLRPKQTLEVYT